MENQEQSYSSGDEKSEKRCGTKEDEKGADVFNIGHASPQNHIKNKKKERKKNDACGNGSSISVQTDGQKFLNRNIEKDYGDMSRSTARNTTFRNFPKKILIDKIIDSGYFYTGKDDITQCYKCGSVVHDWNDKDNPALFHEPDCQFHSNQPMSTEEYGKNDKESNSSMEGTSNSSILDAPITEANSNTLPPPVTLKPTTAATNIVRMNSIPPPGFRNLPNWMDTFPQECQSLPVFNTQLDNQENTESNILGRIPSTPVSQKEFVKRIYKPYLTLSGIVEKNHKTLLENLNLCAEEDRRKTFLIKDAWRQNTNNVVNPNDLAADGFFYLGNLDRTQCFSCNKIFKTWQRSDRVNKVHKKEVPYCKMASGCCEKNIPIPHFQLIPESLTSISSSDPSSGGFHKLKDFESMQDETSLEISKSTISSSAMNIQHSNMPFEFPKHPVQPGANLMDVNEGPLDLTIKKNLLLLPQDNSQEEPLSIEESNTNISPSNSEDLPYSMQPASDDEDMQFQENLPIPPIAIQTTANVPPASQSWHLGQTTLYNTTSNLPTSNEDDEQSQMSGAETTPLQLGTTILPGSSNEHNWAEIFPCEDPVNREMSSAVARQDTFDFRWTQRGIGNADEFARAGFYYSGDEDNVRCWYCGGGVRHWGRDDDPWEEHARLYPDCEFLLQQKGPEFISEISSRQRANTPEPPAMIQTARYSSSSSDESPYSSFHIPGLPRFSSYLNDNQQSGYNQPPQVVDPREEEAKRKRMLEEALNSEGMLMAVDMGFDLKMIKRTIKNKIRNSDRGFASTQDFLDALLSAPPGRSDSSSDSDEDEQVPPVSSITPVTPTQAPTTSTTVSILPSTSGAQGGDVQPRVSPSAGGDADLDPKKMDEKLREYEQEKRCKVCLDRDAVVVFVPCGHLCTCIPCANALRNCPLCRKRITKSMKIYTT